MFHFFKRFSISNCSLQYKLYNFTICNKYSGDLNSSNLFRRQTPFGLFFSWWAFTRYKTATEFKSHRVQQSKYTNVFVLFLPISCNRSLPRLLPNTSAAFSLSCMITRHHVIQPNIYRTYLLFDFSKIQYFNLRESIDHIQSVMLLVRDWITHQTTYKDTATMIQTIRMLTHLRCSKVVTDASGSKSA